MESNSRIITIPEALGRVLYVSMIVIATENNFQRAYN